MSKNKKNPSIDPENQKKQDLLKSYKNELSITNQEKELINEYQELVTNISRSNYARKKTPATVELNDLIGAGFDGLLKAIRSYNQAKVEEFKIYASIRIRGEILDFIRKEWAAKGPNTLNKFKEGIKNRISQVIDNELISTTGKVNSINLLSTTTTAYMLSLEALSDEGFTHNIKHDTQELVETQFEIKDEHNTLNNIIESLDDEKKLFIDLFYKQELSQKQISQQLNFSEAKVSRIHKNLLSDLKKKINLT